MADGFKVYASSTMLGSNDLDNCNGKFTYNAATGKYTVRSRRNLGSQEEAGLVPKYRTIQDTAWALVRRGRCIRHHDLVARSRSCFL